jgi:hypothetical protein
MIVLAKREVTNKAGLSLIEQGHQQRLEPGEWRNKKQEIMRSKV